MGAVPVPRGLPGAAGRMGRGAALRGGVGGVRSRARRGGGGARAGPAAACEVGVATNNGRGGGSGQVCAGGAEGGGSGPPEGGGAARLSRGRARCLRRAAGSSPRCAWRRSPRSPVAGGAAGRRPLGDPLPSAAGRVPEWRFVEALAAVARGEVGSRSPLLSLGSKYRRAEDVK